MSSYCKTKYADCIKNVSHAPSLSVILVTNAERELVDVSALMWSLHLISSSSSYLLVVAASIASDSESYSSWSTMTGVRRLIEREEDKVEYDHARLGQDLKQDHRFLSTNDLTGSSMSPSQNT